MRELTKQILLLRLDMINQEEREYVAGMKGMCEIRRDSPEVKHDNMMLANFRNRRDAIRLEIAHVDEEIKREARNNG